MDRVTHKALVKLREELLEQAEAAMRFPKKDPFEHGTQVGFWQGLEAATQIIEAALKDELEDDSRR